MLSMTPVALKSHSRQDLERNEKVTVYAKLPPWFKVPTPLGSYNPDWAVVVEDEGDEKLYFVVETKGQHVVMMTYVISKVPRSNAERSISMK